MGVGVGPLADGPLDLLGMLQSRAEVDGQLVGAGHERRPHVEAVAAVHVGGAAQDDVVEGDRGDRVQPVEDEVNPLIGRALAGSELERILPARAVRPGELLFGQVNVRVRDQAGGKQVQVDTSRHLSGDDLP